MKKKTVGAQIQQNAQSQTDSSQINVMELQQSMQEDYMKELLDLIDKDYHKYPGDFYVVVLTKAERLLANTFRNYFLTRHSCPTPFYDQTVWRYNKKMGRVEYLWTVPGKEECKHILMTHKEIPTEGRQLVQFVWMFFNGELLKLAQKFNKETQEQGILYRKKEEEIHV